MHYWRRGLSALTEDLSSVLALDVFSAIVYFVVIFLSSVNVSDSFSNSIGYRGSRGLASHRCYTVSRMILD